MAVCEVCQLEGQFYVSDGVTFCQGCGAESQDHGQQMVVDDETLGQAFILGHFFWDCFFWFHASTMTRLFLDVF